MNTYSDSEGNRYSQSVINRKITEAKAETLNRVLDQYDHFKCEKCGNNGTGTRLDCSHQISVKEAKETGRVELCWDLNNIKMLCRGCHSKLDGVELQFSSSTK